MCVQLREECAQQTICSTYGVMNLSCVVVFHKQSTLLQKFGFWFKRNQIPQWQCSQTNSKAIRKLNHGTTGRQIPGKKQPPASKAWSSWAEKPTNLTGFLQARCYSSNITEVGSALQTQSVAALGNSLWLEELPVSADLLPVCLLNQDAA